MSSRGGRGGGKGGPLPRDVLVSKKMSWLLRHGAEKEGLELRPGGWVGVGDALNTRALKSLKVTFPELRQIVKENNKQRFSMIPVSGLSSTQNPSEALAAAASQADQAAAKASTPAPSPDPPTEPAKGTNPEQEHPSSTPPTPIAEEAQPSTDPHDYLIRANQGHSLPLDAASLLTPITPSTLSVARDAGTDICAIHGTTHAAWVEILASGGLRPMGRNHVHFAAGLPKGFVQHRDSTSDSAPPHQDPVISGMRASSTVLVHVDLPAALDAGIRFWRSDNGVLLSSGVEEADADDEAGMPAGVVPLRFFKRVEDRAAAGEESAVLMAEGKLLREPPASWKGKAGGGIGGRGGRSGREKGGKEGGKGGREGRGGRRGDRDVEGGGGEGSTTGEPVADNR